MIALLDALPDRPYLPHPIELVGAAAGKDCAILTLSSVALRR